MGFEDTLWNIEQTVIKPLRDFRRNVTPLNQIHNDNVSQFASIMGGLLTGSDGNTAFQGQGSMAMADMVGKFLDGEGKLCGSTHELMGRLLDASIICEKSAQELEQRLNQIAVERDHTAEMLAGAAVTMDGGAALQGGVDIPWDIIAVGLTGLAAIAAATRNLDEVKTQDAESAAGLEIMVWENDMDRGPNTEPLNRLPPDPKGPSGDTIGFLKMLGITIGVTGVVLAAGAIIVNLSPTQEDLAKRLHNDYGSSGLSLDDIRAIIAANPNLSEKQLRELLDQYGKVIKANPNLVSTYGALAVFEEFIALAAYDAAHGGDYANKQPVQNMPNLAAGIEEAEAGMGAMEAGLVPWPLTPSQQARYDVSDPTGTQWDVKSYRSVNTDGHPYNAADTAQKLQKDFNKGEKIIFDDRQLTQKEIDDTYEELKKRNQENDVVWWPIQPTQLHP